MREPVAIGTALGAVLSTGVAVLALFLPGITPDRSLAIIAFGNALIAFGVAWFGRSQTTPTAAPVLSQGTSVTVTTPAGESDREVTLSPSVVEGYGRDVG